MALCRIVVLYTFIATGIVYRTKGQCPVNYQPPVASPPTSYGMINTEAKLRCAFSCQNIYPTWQKLLPSLLWTSIRGNLSLSGYYITPESDLYVPQIDDCTAGTYRCVADIDQTTVAYSNNVTISVLRTPVLALCNMESGSVCFDSVQTSRNVCIITDGNPGVIWSINRIQGHQNINQQFLTTLTPVSAASQCQSGSVIRSNTTMMQLSIGLDKDSNNPISSGMYTLMASYPSGERKNLTLNINVSGPDFPNPSTPDNVILLNYSQSISIQCSVKSSAVQSVLGCGGQTINSGMSILWTRLGMVVPQDPSQPVYVTNTSYSSNLILQNFQRNQSGQYTCQATNIQGTSTSSTSVYGPPDPVSGLILSPVVEDTVTLSWTPLTYSPFTITYRVHYGKVDAGRLSALETMMPTAMISGLQEGYYEAYVVVIANVSSIIVAGLESVKVYFTVNPSGLSQAASITIGVSTGGIAISVTLIVIGIFLMLKYYSVMRKHKNQQRSWGGEDDVDHHTCAVNHYVTPLTLNPNTDISAKPENVNRMSIFGDLDPKWEFPRELLQLSEILHDGYSTVLYKGSAIGIKGDKNIDVAVKSCKKTCNEDDVKALIADMEFLASLGSHPNIIGLLRVCTVESPICMVLEYMCHGDLLGFLRASRGHHGLYTVFPGKREQLPSLNLTSRDIINIAAKIASGMMFLEMKKAVHGSLCASCVLVGTSLDIKINVGAYDLNRDNLLKWMAPETLFDGTATTFSDVWSFGITMWELVTVGGTPYAEILPFDLHTQLSSGMRLPKPMHCAQEVYDIVKICWARIPTERPSFTELHGRLDTMAQSKMSFLDFQLYSDEAYSQFEDDSQLSTPL